MPTTWATGALYWPFVMFLNFKFVPIRNRPLVGSLAGSFWSVWMAYQANKNIQNKDDENINDEAFRLNSEHKKNGSNQENADQNELLK